MANDAARESLIPKPPIPAGAEQFAATMHGLLDGAPKDRATVEQALEGHDAMLDRIAAGLYSLASMLIGEGEEAIRLVETAIATADIGSCATPERARQSSRLALCRAALAHLAQGSPGSLTVPVDAPPVHSCIDEDELDAAGMSRQELATMLSGPERGRVRTWLAGLPLLQRVVFVLRAVAGFTSPETAELLARYDSADARWTAVDVRELFRQALCSLASQLLHAATAGL